MDMADERAAVRELPKLFPVRAQQPTNRVAPLPAQEDIDRFMEELDKTVAHAPTKRGAGPAGGRGEHWSWMPEYADEWEEVKHLCLNQALGRVPQQVLIAFLSARVLAGAKPGEQVRPFALGGILRRCISKAVGKTFQARVAAVVSPEQYAVGGDGGAEVMHKTVLCDLDSHPHSVLQSFDVSNAHNEFDREEALDEVARVLPEMLPWVMASFNTDTMHAYVGPSGEKMWLPKSRGGDQGDAQVSLVFPLVYHKVVRRTQEAAKAIDPAARGYAYQDDLDIVCLPGACVEARAAFKAGCTSIGMRANETKETVAMGRDVQIVDLPQHAKVIDRPIVLRHGATPLPALPPRIALPSPVLEQNSPEVNKLHLDRATLFQRMRALRKAGLSAQEALGLLRLRTGGDYTFIARCCGLPAEDAQKLDQELAVNIREIVGQAGWTGDAEKRCFMPAGSAEKGSGLGFQSAVLTSSAAHAASWQSSIGKITTRLGLEAPSALAAVSPWAAQCVPAVEATLQEAVSDPGVHLGDEGFTTSQRKLAAARVEAAAGDILDSVAPSTAAVIHSAGGAGAAGWLKLPSLPGDYFLDAQFSIAVRTRLHLDIPGSTGPCRHRKKDGSMCGEPLDSKGTHARSCPFGGWLVRRHDAACAVLADWCRQQGCQVDIEVVLPMAHPDRLEARMDLIVRAPAVTGPVRVDLTVVSALSVEALEKGSAQRSGVACEIAAKRRDRDYPLINVVPFAIEDHGRLGVDALKFARKLAPADIGKRSAELARLYQSLGASLQRSAADAVIAATGGSHRAGAI